MQLYKRIRDRRIEKGYSQLELARMLGYKDRSTIAKIESGKNDLNQSKIEAFAQALNTTAAYLMGWTDDPYDYEGDPDNRFADAPKELFEVAEPSRIDRIYQALNSDGQDELVRYGTYLTSQDVYRRDDSKPHVEYIKHYLVPAAAGYASPIEGEDYELIERDPKAPVSADFCITISGDSMEPYIRDGELVYVKRDAALQDFDVGVFYVDGDVFCKQYTIDPFRNLYLLSANPKREDANITISRDSGRNVVCFGKVLLSKRLPRPIYN